MFGPSYNLTCKQGFQFEDGTPEKQIRLCNQEWPAVEMCVPTITTSTDPLNVATPIDTNTEVPEEIVTVPKGYDLGRTITVLK